MTHRGRINALFRAQFGFCAGCGKPMVDSRQRNDDEAPSLDHVWPASLGGSNHISNIVAIHRRCNGAKGDRAPTGCELIWQLVAQVGLALRFTEMPDCRLVRREVTLADVWPQEIAA